MNGPHNGLRLVRAGVDTCQQPVVYMHRDCAVCRAEGFAALTRALIRSGDRELVATLNVVTQDWLAMDVASLPDAARDAPNPGLGGRRLLQGKLSEHRHDIVRHGDDMPEIRNWRWNGLCSL